MSTRGAILKGSAVLTIGKFGSFGCSFIRNIILARMLTKADFGIAATFGMMIALLEFSDKWALDSQVIQSRHTDNPAFMATAHLTQFLIGMSSVLVILVAAAPMARLLGVPHVAGSFRLLILIPISRAIHHLDVSRMIRDMRFAPHVVVEVIPQVLITVAAWPMALWLKDYRALLWLLLARWVMTTIGTHVMARRPYRWGWDRTFLGQIARFGWPLLVNGLLMFGITQGDRMVVGISTTMDDLGTYSVAAQVTIVPGMMVVSILASLLLPIISRVQDNPIAFRNKYRLCAELLAMFGTVFAVFVSLTGGTVVAIVFGSKYAGCGPLVTCLVCAQAVRLMKVAPTIGAMAKSDTQNMMIANAARLVGLVLAIIFVAHGGKLLAVAVAGVLGELLSYAVSAGRFTTRHSVLLSDSTRPALISFLIIAAAVSLSFWHPLSLNTWQTLLLGFGGSLGAAGIISFALPTLRAEIIVTLKMVNMRKHHRESASPTTRDI